jgi:hypothetical protein
VVSFRYLVITVVAIFLALGLGVLAGTTVINQSIVKNLKARTHKAETLSQQLQQQLDTYGDFVNLAASRLVAGRLANKQVVLLADENTDADALGQVRDYLDQAKASVVTELRVRSSMASSNATSGGLVQILAEAGVTGSGTPTESAATALADRLANGPPASVATGPKPHDLLSDLLSAGYLDFPHDTPPNPKEVGGGGQVVVAVAGGDTEPAVPLTEFMVPFVEELVADGVPVAAGEPTAAKRSFVGLLRDDATITSAGEMVTVDDLSASDSFGGVALVLGLKELIRFGQGGDYGVKGATSIIPGPP